MSEEEECEGDDDLKCSVGEWSDFTPCDAECDQTGQMFRNRLALKIDILNLIEQYESIAFNLLI